MSPSKISEDRQQFSWTPATMTVAGVLAALIAVMIWTSLPRPQSHTSCDDYVEQHNGATNGQDNAAVPPVDCVSPRSAEETNQANHEENPWPEIWIAFGTWALVCGTFYLGFFTYKLWQETGEAARKQRRADRKAHRRELRAYVGIEHFICEVTSSTAGSTAKAHIGFCNFGQTPALNARAYGYFQILPWAESPFFAVAEVDPFASKATLGPSAKRTRSSHLRGTFKLNDVTPVGDTAASTCLLAWGTIVYEDVFGETHRTYFKGYLGGNQVPMLDQSRGGAADYRMMTYWNGNESD